MKRSILVFLTNLIFLCGYSQHVGMKSNLLYGATSTINLGVEFALSDKLTLDLSANYNPWAFPQQKVTASEVIVAQYDAVLKHWMIQPELRWWFCEKFNGHFAGMHVHGGQMNVGGLTFLPDRWSDRGIQKNRIEGWLAGTGFAYGYHLIVSNRLSLEFSIGVGYMYLHYDKYVNYTSLRNPSKDPNAYKMHYVGPTKAGISLIYMLY